MSVTAEFEGTYEERDDKIRKAIELLKDNFPDAKLRYLNPKGLSEHVIYSLLIGIEQGLRESGRSAARKLVDYFFDEMKGRAES